MIKGIKFASIPVTDQDRALEFYTKKLGFRVLTDQPFDDHQRWIELGIAGADTSLVLFTAARQRCRIRSGASDRGLGHGGRVQGHRWQCLRAVIQVMVDRSARFV
jgi:catechol 2,3-dioxygenase-like lactoylglutathione lyase family enzyme